MYVALYTNRLAAYHQQDRYFRIVIDAAAHGR